MWNKKIFFVTSLILGVLMFFVGIHFYINKVENKENYVKKYDNKIYTYILSGALKHTGIHRSNRLLTYKELFVINKVLPNSSLKDFELSEIAPRNEEIYVPFENYKLKWSELENIEQLLKINIQKRYAKLIINHKKKYKKTSWAQISNIFGIGPRIILKLKNFLILD
ncbi:MAG0490 family ComEA-like DNA-binding protein [Mycoplasma sp. CSL10166]|uniref:MAG0490 family ComEA-like DNA-binding protein n=1 Tax=unclassified Mycoplasma TaxID=2683645 RepID=UPI0035BE65A6